MNNYEALFIIKPDIKEEDLKNVSKAISDAVVKHSGTINKEESWGKKQLAYPIEKIRDGYYYKLEFTAPAEAIAKLEAGYKLNAEILRMMITRR